MLSNVPAQTFVKAFLNKVTRKRLDKTVTDLAKDPRVREYINEVSEAPNEDAMYPPLTALINKVIDDVSPMHPMRLKYLRLGNKVLGDSGSVRKPDGALVETAVHDAFLAEWKKAGLAEKDVAELEIEGGLRCVPGPKKQEELKDGKAEARVTGVDKIHQAEMERMNAGKQRRPDVQHTDTLTTAGLAHGELQPEGDGARALVKKAKKIAALHLPWQVVGVAFEVKHKLKLKSKIKTKAQPKTQASAHSGSSSQAAYSTQPPPMPSSSRSFRNPLKRASDSTHHSAGPVAKKIKTDSSASQAISASSPNHVTDDEVQLVSYITEMRSVCGNRIHALGCSFHKTGFEVFYVDPCGWIKSEVIDIREETAEFVWLIIALAQADNAALGFDQRFQPPGATEPISDYPLPTSLEGWSFTIKDNVRVTINGIAHLQWCCFGRGTSVYRVQWNDTEAALKVSYPYATRPREVQLLDDARAIVGDRVVKVYEDGQGTLVSKGFRSRLDPDNGVEGTDRRPEFLVMELLEPLHSLPTKEYIFPFLGIMQTLFDLSKGGIYHRDISSGNLMVRVIAERPQGVVIDFDLAVNTKMTGTYDNSLTHRTGTLPFLALSVLQGGSPAPRHIFRFDLESCVYVFIWDAVAYPEGLPGREFRKGEFPLLPWLDRNMRQNFDSKTNLYMRLEELGDMEGLARCQDELLRLLLGLHIGMANLIGASKRLRRSNDPADVEAYNLAFETVCGEFTFEKVKESFERTRDLLNPESTS